MSRVMEVIAMNKIPYFQRKNHKDWITRVSSVFDIRPRDASNPKNKIWLSRDVQEKELQDKLYAPGVHVCIDGPSGTGKSSLALTILGITETKYVPIQLVEKMTWQDFCKKLVSNPNSYKESNVSYGFEAGLESGLPTAKLQVSLGKNIGGGTRSLDEVVSGWTEHDVCQEMVKEKTALLIDDFENVNDELLIRIADMAKLLTQSYSNTSSKLILVGTDDIYRRIYSKRRSLEGRLAEISLGTFPERNHSWKYLLLGFDALELINPANSKIESEQRKKDACIRAIYDAADGLPKSLTQLGSEISISSFGRNSVTAHDITTTSLEYTKNKIRRFRSQYPDIMKMLNSYPVERDIFVYLITEGSGRIYHIDDVINSIKGKYDEEQINLALLNLVKKDLIVQTGTNNDILFFKDLSMIHTLSVVAQQPAKYGFEPDVFAPLAQMSLPF